MPGAAPGMARMRDMRQADAPRTPRSMWEMMGAIETIQDARALVFRTRSQTQKAKQILVEFQSVLDRTRRRISETEKRIATSDELIEYQSSIVRPASGAHHPTSICSTRIRSGVLAIRREADLNESENIPQGLKPNVYGPSRHD
jgi:hypothetical protein